MDIVIGITDTASRYENYPAWITGNRTDIEIVKLSASLDNAHETTRCHGVLFSGGVDIHPKFYGFTNEKYAGAPDEFDLQRDEFEFSVFEIVRKHRIPALGICRGLQLINIALGGTLIPDLQTIGKLDHTRHGLVDGVHDVETNKDSLLYSITGTKQSTINSAHHQAIDKIAPTLNITAYSPDNVPEAAEYADFANNPWLLLVQWHPERLFQTNPGSPLEKEIQAAFLQATGK